MVFMLELQSVFQVELLILDAASSLAIENRCWYGVSIVYQNWVMDNKQTILGCKSFPDQ
jgi:hypothetical protein